MANNTTITAKEIKKSKIFSPGLIGGEEVHFLPSEKNTFFLKHKGKEGYLKDETGKYVKMGIDEVVEARLLYLSSYQNKEIKKEIQAEYKKLCDDLVKKAEDIIKKITDLELHKNGEYYKDDDTLSIIIKQNNPEYIDRQKNMAIMYFDNNPDALKFRDKLKIAIEDKDYDLLYHLLEFKFGEPIATFKHGQGQDLKALINIFGAGKINNTMDTMAEKGALYLKAQVAVNKKYFPEN